MDGNVSNGYTDSNKYNGSSNFNLVIGVATLLIAILGATFAYFSATARSEENAVTVQSAYVSISYEGGTEIVATNLIPSTKHVALTKYQKQVDPYNPEMDSEINTDYDQYISDPGRRCTDAYGKEVCYVYQFSVVSDGVAGESTDILASIKVNQNQFDNLSYVLYEVDFRKKENETQDVVYDKYGFGIVDRYTLVSNFSNLVYDNVLPDENDKYANVTFAKFEKPEDLEGDNGEYVGTVYPVACLFGYKDKIDGEEEISVDNTDRCKTHPVTNGVKHTYQLVIWLNETGDIQNEQGMKFAGTVSIDVSGGGIDNGGSEDGKITGKENKDE